LFGAVIGHNYCVSAHSVLDLHQKKYGFYAKTGHNPLQVTKIVVPLHRQKEIKIELGF
jgi:hypothetical protein